MALAKMLMEECNNAVLIAAEAVLVESYFL